MKLLLPRGPFDAYLFDCDGTIADSMPLHYQAWTEALKPRGCEFLEKDHSAWAGSPTPHVVELLNEKYGLQMPVEEVAAEKEGNYFKLLPRIQAVPAVVREIEHPPTGVQLAVVSGSPRNSVLRTLRSLGLLDHFPVIVGAEDYPRGKPSPDPFLVAAQRLKVKPERCLVFEDAELGFRAAEAAGMKWVKVDPRELEREDRE